MHGLFRTRIVLFITLVAAPGFVMLDALAQDAAVEAGAAAVEAVPVKLTGAEAGDHVGEVATVCGTVFGTRYLDGSQKKPTFLNLDQRHPNQLLTVVIFGEDRDKFSEAPETFFDGKKICVTGKIDLHNGKPQIVVSDPAKITVEESRDPDMGSGEATTPAG